MIKLPDVFSILMLYNIFVTIFNICVMISSMNSEMKRYWRLNMNKKIRKIAVYCTVGSLAFMGRVKTAYASSEPVAGITVLLEDINTNPEVIENILEYSDLAIANVNNYVNIRSEANTDSKVLGKLYSNGTAKILETEGEWLKIQSGDVTGYIKSEYMITGSEVYDMVDDVKTTMATVNANKLNVRAKASISSSVLAKVPKGDKLEVLEEDEEWIKVSLGSKVGYVAADYVKVNTEFKEAISIEEEQERLKLEQENAVSSLRQQIVNYALRFKGNPYVWGGTSLTRGADCSGFTQSIFKYFGIYLPRTSRAQAYGGKRVSLSNMKPGDLVFYTKNGRINHVAIYIGNGQVIGASSRKEGITIKNCNYRKPYMAASYINN